MSNLKDSDGIGNEEISDLDAVSPLSRSTGGQGERCNHYINADRLGIPLDNEQLAVEYARSLNALNAAFGCYDLQSLAPEAPQCRVNYNPGQGSPDGTEVLPNNNDRNRAASGDVIYQWQHPGSTTGLLLGLSESLNTSPQVRECDAIAETLDGQTHVEGMFGSKRAKTLLPKDYKPSDNSVILGRGRCSESIGNRRFKVVVLDHLQEYLEAPGKLEKTIIVSKVLNIIEEACPVGAFVKYQNGRWWSAGERASREKIGASFRDALHTHYKSSSKSKVATRKAKALGEKDEP